jgi:hypothetical protein
MGSLPPKLNSKPIYGLVVDPLGIVIPTYSKEEYDKVCKSCFFWNLVFVGTMLGSTLFSLGLFIYFLVTNS